MLHACYAHYSNPILLRVSLSSARGKEIEYSGISSNRVQGSHNVITTADDASQVKWKEASSYPGAVDGILAARNKQ